MQRPCRTILLLASVSALALLGFIGCGGSGSNDASQAQIEAAKAQGEEHARETDRVDDLQQQVRHLRGQIQRADTGVAVVKGGGVEATGTAGNGFAVLRTFHTESGNVSCEILSDGARCFVAPTGTTFAFSGGSAARIETASSVAPESGELAPYGTSVSAGVITCTIPPSSSPHGVICADSASGHGFEASRVLGRQNAY